METNIVDRFNAWVSDPDTPQEPTLLDAFAEGFAQAMEWISGQLSSSQRTGSGTRKAARRACG
jgi:hypothetical protein